MKYNRIEVDRPCHPYIIIVGAPCYALARLEQEKVARNHRKCQCYVHMQGGVSVADFRVGWASRASKNGPGEASPSFYYRI